MSWRCEEAATVVAAGNGCHGDGDWQLACGQWLRRPVTVRVPEYNAALLYLLALPSLPSRHRPAHFPFRKTTTSNFMKSLFAH